KTAGDARPTSEVRLVAGRWHRRALRRVRTAHLSVAMLTVAAVAAGCRQDMHNQPKYLPLRESKFFADGMSARQFPQGTVARGHPVGYFFDVMTHGFGVMPSYAAQVPPEDRWAIAAYVRVLQMSQRAHLADLEPVDRQALAALPTAPETAPAPVAPAAPAPAA